MRGATLFVNPGDAGVRDLSVRIVDPFGVEIARVADEPWELGSGDAVLSFDWNVGSTPPGSYAVVAELAESGVTRARAVSGISVAAEVRIDATLLADRQRYAPHQTALLTGAVTNAGANTLMTGVTVLVAVADAQYVEWFSTTRTIDSFSPGAVLPVAASWEIAAAPPGSYTASLSVRDDQDRLVAYAATELVVESSADTGAGLVGEVSVAPAEVGAGAPLITTWTVTNTGNADLTDIVARLDLLAIATEEIVAFEDAYLDLAQQETRAGGTAFATLALAPGTYLATLSALVPGGPVRLDGAAFTVGRGVSIADVAVLEGDAGTRLAAFTASLSYPAAEVIRVDYATADGSAAAGSDYETTTGTVTFDPGATTATVEVTIYGDVDVEIDEVFLVNLSNPQGVDLGDAQGVGTILDGEGCASPNLLRNPGAEESDPATPAPEWTVAGDDWHRAFGDPVPLADAAYFAADGVAELNQDVDVAVFAPSIDAAEQSFAFETFMHAATGAGSAQLVVEFRDLDDVTVLDQYDSGVVAGTGAWQAVGGELTAPVGTRRIRVRLLAEGTAAFDRAALHSLGRLTLVVDDATVTEGNSGTTQAGFHLSLSCPSATPVDVDYATAAGSATEGEDYVAPTAPLVFAAGEIEQTLTVDVLGDTTDEDDETSRHLRPILRRKILELAGLASPAVLLRRIDQIWRKSRRESGKLFLREP